MPTTVTGKATDLITFSRASLGTVVDSDGKIKWAPHNLVLNSAAPVTQSITVTSGAKYKVEMTGSGSVALSGAGSGTVSTGSPVEITASTTTLTLTVSGTVSTMWAYRSDLGGMKLNGAGTAYNPTTTAAYHGPRLDYDPSTLAAKGLLVEEQRTNLMTYSEDMTQSVWVRSNSLVTANAATAPSGAVKAAKFYEDTANSNHYVSFFTPSTSTAYAVSFYAKAAERNYVQFSGGGFAGQGYNAVFNLSDGTMLQNAGGKASIVSVGGGWYRCTVSFTTSTVGGFGLYIWRDAATSSYTGDGASGLYIYGMQVEAGAFATSYIPTTSASVTRSADVASVGTSQFPYSATEGTLVFNGANLNSANAVNYHASLDDGTTNNIIGLRANASSALATVVYSSGVLQWSYTGSTFVAGSVVKTAVSYKANDYATVLNGGTVGTASIASVPLANRLALGAGPNAILPLNGWIRQITYIPRRLSNAELQARTA